LVAQISELQAQVARSLLDKINEAKMSGKKITVSKVRLNLSVSLG